MPNINDYGFPFTSVSGDRQYSSSEWREYFESLVESGIVGAVANELQVKPQAIPNKTVYVDTGSILIKGALRSVATTTTLACADNISGNPRIDRIVARLNLTDRKIEFAVLQGTPAGSPTAPALTQNATIWELSLAKITLVNGYSTITVGDITDERTDETVCGYFKYRAKPAWYPSGGDIPIDAWMYLVFKNQLTAQEITDIEANSTLMAIINGNTIASLIPPNTSSYIAFCTNANVNAIDSAFGKNNESIISGIGKQLAMYAWFKGASKTTYPFTNLTTCNTFAECLSNPYALVEILVENNYIKSLIALSTGYASALFNSADVGKAVAIIAGLNPNDYANISALTSNSTTMTAIASNASAMNIFASNSAVMTAFASSATAMNILASSTTAMSAIASSGVALNCLIKSTIAKTALLANTTLFNNQYATMLATMDGATTLFTKTTKNGVGNGSGSWINLTIGTANSFVNVLDMTDANATNGWNWTEVKHKHNNVELIHSAFPTGTGVGTVTVNKIAIGGVFIQGTPSSNMAYNTFLYEAI